MPVKIGSFSPGATGNVSIGGLTFLPTRLIMRMGSATGSIDTSVTSRSDGWCTATNQSYDCHFRDATGPEQIGGTDKCIRLRKRVTGSMQNRVAATFVSFDNNGGGDYGFTLNFSEVDANYQVRYTADDN